MKVAETLNNLAKLLHDNETSKGFNDAEEKLIRILQYSPNEDLVPTVRQVFAAQKLALAHSEVSEATEALRKPHLDAHCTEFSNEVIEVADSIIRLLSYAHHRKFSIGEAIMAKMGYNATRPHMHGKAF